jgi:hypothetical protein
MAQSELKRLALLMAVNCVRNTVIEDYHSDGKLSDAEMKALNQEVVNKIYTFLHYLFSGPEDDQATFLAAMGVMYPSEWDEPNLDADFTEAVNLFKGMGGMHQQDIAHRHSGARTSPKRAPKRDRR